MNAVPRTAVMPPIRILLISDRGLLRAGLRTLLDSQPGMMVVAEVDCCAKALTVTCEEPDVILLNLDLTAGLHEVPDLLAFRKGARLLVLISGGAPEVHHQAIRIGATGAVQKEEPPEVLVKAIEKVHAGEAWFDRSAIADVLMEMTRANGSHRNGAQVGGVTDLTKREREVVTHVAEGLKNKQIANRLFISEVTVRHHLTSIFSKLGVSDRLELMIYAFRHRLAEPPR
jgi:two-component system nitrate/nitrite response regulator NarL